MFVDMPDLQQQYAPVMVALTNQAQQAASTPRTAGVCQVMPNRPGVEITLENSLSPDAYAANYLFEFEKRHIDDAGAIVTFVQLPKHGKLINEVRGASVSKGGNNYSYVPDPGYYGRDKVIALVRIDGYQVKVVYFLQAVKEDIGDTWEGKYCGPKGMTWKISLPDTPLDTPTIQSLLSFTGIDTPVKVAISDLAGGALGSTQGTTITLNTNAAGHGWFIDATPGRISRRWRMA